MIDVKPLNLKLQDRARRILVKTTGATYNEAARALEKAGMHTKTAFVMLKTGLSAEEAKKKLEEAGGFVRAVIEA